MQPRDRRPGEFGGGGGASRRARSRSAAGSVAAAAGAAARAAARRGACPTCPTPPPRRPLSRRASRSCARVLRKCSRALPRAHLCSRARSFSILKFCVQITPSWGSSTHPCRPWFGKLSWRTASAHRPRMSATPTNRCCSFWGSRCCPPKDFALECTLGAPSTANDAVVGEPQLLGAAVLSAPDVGGCSCGGGSGGSGGGGGLTGNLLLCLRC
jgi:hypothetical protein